MADITIQELFDKLDVIEKLLRRVLGGERKERDEFLTTKQFLERERVKARSMYYVLKLYPELKSRKDGFGLMINYTLYKKIKR